jgi:hypothetical protein
MSWEPVAHTYNQSYLGGGGWEGWWFEASEDKSFLRLHLQNNHGKIDWSYGSSSRAPLCKCEALSLNPSPIKKKKKKTDELFANAHSILIFINVMLFQ